MFRSSLLRHGRYNILNIEGLAVSGQFPGATMMDSEAIDSILIHFVWPLVVLLFGAVLLWIFKNPIWSFFYNKLLFVKLVVWTRSRVVLGVDPDESMDGDFQCKLCMSPICKYLAEELMKDDGTWNWPCYVFKAGMSLGKSCGSKYFLTEMMEDKNMIGIHITPRNMDDYELGLRQLMGFPEEASVGEFMDGFLRAVKYARFTTPCYVKGRFKHVFMCVRKFFSSDPGLPSEPDLSPVVVFFDAFDMYSERNKNFAFNYMKAADDYARVATVFLCQDKGVNDNDKSIADEISKMNGKAKIRAWKKLVDPACDYAQTPQGRPVENKQLVWCDIEWADEEINFLVTNQEYCGETLALPSNIASGKYKISPGDAIKDALEHAREKKRNRNIMGGSTKWTASDYRLMTDPSSPNIV